MKPQETGIGDCFKHVNSDTLNTKYLACMELLNQSNGTDVAVERLVIPFIMTHIPGNYWISSVIWTPPS